jgi:hypothetical protein
LICIAALIAASSPAQAAAHFWRVKEIFSNADGTIQFIELATCCMSTAERSLAGHIVRSSTNSFTIPSNVLGSTLDKHLLLGTAAYAALPGAPPPDHIIAPTNGPSFFSVASDTITFSFYDMLIFSAGQLPTDGVNSLNKDPEDITDPKVVARNSPTNYAGVTGSVSAVSGPPGVPDGSDGTAPVTVLSLDAEGSSLRISFDSQSCAATAANYHILYGQRSGFPAAPGGNYTLLGVVCGIGTASPYDWIGVPRPTDGSNLLWFVMTATDARVVEGSWGTDSRANERNGPGNNGASAACAEVKDLTNTCGHSH